MSRRARACIAIACSMLWLCAAPAWADGDRDEATGRRSAIAAAIPVQRDATGASEGAGQRAWMALGASALLLGVGTLALRWRVRRGSAAAVPAAPMPWLTGWRAMTGGAAPAELSCTASLQLGPRHRLHVIDWSGRQYLVACTEQAVQLLAQAPAEAAHDPQAAAAGAAAEGPIGREAGAA